MKRTSLSEKGVDVPIQIHAEWQKGRKDYIVTCPNGHGQIRVSEQRLKHAGREKAPNLKTLPMFYAVADSWLYKGLWDHGLAILDNKAGSYSEFRAQMAIASRNTPKEGVVLFGETSLLLDCGCTVRVTFGVPGAEIRPEPDLVDSFLKLGMTKEIDWRWMRYIEYGDTPRPLSFGKKKAEELYKLVMNLEDEKHSIEKAAEDITATINGIARQSVFGSDVRSVVNSAKTRRLREIEETQYGRLRGLEEIFERVALRPGSLVGNLKQHFANLKEKITGSQGSVIIVDPTEEEAEEVEIQTWGND